MKKADRREKTKGRRVRRSLNARNAMGFCLLIAALATEFAKPKSERTREGKVIGLVPYDFRKPTFARIRSRVWNPADDHFIVPKAFGVGWTLNIGRVFRSVGSNRPRNARAINGTVK